MVGERISLFLMGFYLGENNLSLSFYLLIFIIGIHFLEYEFEYKRNIFIQDELIHEHGMNSDE